MDADGWGAQDKPQVTFLGGFLGQLMLVLNTIAKFYPQLDRPSKSSKGLRSSHNSRPKSQTSHKSGGAASQASGKQASKRDADEDAVSEIPRQILNNEVVQQFMYAYINEKMKVEKMALQVDGKYEQFLQGLANPLSINEMRTMKEKNY